MKAFRWQAREKFQKVDLDPDPIDNDRADQHLRMILRHVEDDDQNRAADPEVVPAEDEVDLDPGVIDQVAADPDQYHQQNIKNNVILAIAKIPPGRELLVFSIWVGAPQKKSLEEFLNDMAV